MCNTKKLISIVVPNYNEVDMLDELYERTTKVMQTLDKYDYEIVFFDDGSKDGSRKKIDFLPCCSVGQPYNNDSYGWRTENADWYNEGIRLQ